MPTTRTSFFQAGAGVAHWGEKPPERDPISVLHRAVVLPGMAYFQSKISF